MRHTELTIQTVDGRCPAHVFEPEGTGPWPAVLMYMDGIGIRPALFSLAERLAVAGYYALLPDLFYRSGPYTPPDPRQLFADPQVRADWLRRYIGTVTIESAMRDTAAFLEFLAAQADVRQPKIGTVGYCMSGKLALAAASRFPDRVAAAASYHGGALGSDAPDSVHRMMKGVQAVLYVGVASNDPPPRLLAEALREAGVTHTIETYPAQHGWVPGDTPVHDAAAAERHWETLLGLLAATLRA
jgi:carboxymethylenebutenolidase